jgi:hypothetical protein
MLKRDALSGVVINQLLKHVVMQWMDWGFYGATRVTTQQHKEDKDSNNSGHLWCFKHTKHDI